MCCSTPPTTRSPSLCKVCLRQIESEDRARVGFKRSGRSHARFGELWTDAVAFGREKIRQRCPFLVTATPRWAPFPLRRHRLSRASHALLFLYCSVGVCMGTAFRNVRPPPGLGLYPLLVLPSVPHETVRLVRCPQGGGASFPAPVT